MCLFGSSLATYGVAFHKHRHVPILLCSFHWIPTNLFSRAFKMYGSAQQSGRRALAVEPGIRASPKELNHQQQSLSHLLLGGHIVQPKCQPGWQLRWGQIFAASAADIVSGSGISVCQTLNKISSVQTQVLPFSFSFPPYSLCSLQAPFLLQFLPFKVVFSATGQARVGRDREGTGTKKIIKLQILFSISWSLPASVVPQGTSWNVNSCVWC